MDGNVCKGIWQNQIPLKFMQCDSQFVIFPISEFNLNRPNLLLERYCTYHVFLFIECPIGHFGRNCSNKCSPPNFGYLCGQECPSYCKTCHYIFGCTITTETKGKSYEFKLVIMKVFYFQRKTFFLEGGGAFLKSMLSPA